MTTDVSTLGQAYKDHVDVINAMEDSEDTAGEQYDTFVKHREHIKLQLKDILADAQNARDDRLYDYVSSILKYDGKKV